MYNEELLMHFFELQDQYEKKNVGKTQEELYPRIWFKIDDYDVLSKCLEEALSKNVLLNELKSIYELEMIDLDNRLNDVFEKGIKRYGENFFKK